MYIIPIYVEIDCLKRAASIDFPLPVKMKRHRGIAISLDALIAWYSRFKRIEKV